MIEEKKITTYKVFITIIFGLMGFFANFYPLNVLIPPNRASFVWGLVFPMLVSLFWGWRYGLLSATLGLGAQTMWILWLPKNGWAPFVAIPFYTFWIMWHGWCTKQKKSGFLSSLYSAEVPFRLLYAIVLTTIFSWSFRFNPSPWAPQMTITTAPPAFVNFLQFKVIIEGYIVLLLADVLRNIDFVKKIFLAREERENKSTYILSSAMLFGLFYWIVSGIAHHTFSTKNYSLADNLILNMAPEEGIERLIVITMCLIAGLLLNTFFSRYRASEDKYRNVFSSIRDTIIVGNTDRTIIDANQPALRKMFGYDIDEIKGKYANILYLNDDEFKRVGDVAFSNNTELKEETVEARLKRKDGSIFTAEMDARRLLNEYGEIVGNFGVIRDITKRKEAEKELQEREYWLSESQSAARIGTYNFNISSGLWTCTSVLNQIFGIDENYKKNPEGWTAIVHPEHRQMMKDYLKSIISDIQPFDKIYKILRVNDGTLRWVHGQGKLIIENEVPTKIIGTIQDITEQKEAENAVIRSEQKFRNLFSSIRDVILVADNNRNIVNVNQPALKDTFGYEVDELKGKPTAVLYASMDGFKQTGKEVYNSEGVSVGRLMEIDFKKKDGTVFPSELFALKLFDEHGKAVGNIGIIRDISEQKRMELEINKAQKLESLGVLAGGIAHDFNNLLTSIYGNVSLAKLTTDAGSPTYDKLNDIEKALARTKDLTHQLLTFSKGGEPVRKSINIASLIEDTVKFCLSGTNVVTVLNISDNLSEIEVDKGQISQVIQNLVINANDAMPNGGTLYVKAENIRIEDGTLPQLQAGEYVAVHIRDTGNGIAQEITDKIFDPFFTTKDSGSGLGLASSYSIVKRHKGLLSVYSEEGSGAEFHIYLPVTYSSLGSKETQDAVIYGTGNILVMDDEEDIRLVSNELLKALGYSVELVSNGEEAVEKYVQAIEKGKPFDAVILDLTIKGGIGGRDTIRKLLEIDPKVKAIVSSGYAEGETASNYQEYGFKAEMSKPYSVEKLSQVLNQVING